MYLTLGVTWLCRLKLLCDTVISCPHCSILKISPSDHWWSDWATKRWRTLCLGNINDTSLIRCFIYLSISLHIIILIYFSQLFKFLQFHLKICKHLINLFILTRFDLLFRIFKFFWIVFKRWFWISWSWFWTFIWNVRSAWYGCSFLWI